MKLAMRVAAAATISSLLAGTSHAAIMVASLGGDYNDDPFYTQWALNIVYDTAKMTVVDVPGGQGLLWEAGSGTPSPIVELNGLVLASQTAPPFFPEDETFVPFPDVFFAFSDFTSFRVTRPFGEYHFQAFGPGGFFIDIGGATSDGSPQALFPLDGVYGGGPNFEYGSWSVGTMAGGDNPHIHYYFSVDRLAGPAIPEPATWTTMILGFGMAGAMLRRRRQPQPA